MANVKLKVNARKDKEGKEFFEGTVTLQGLKPAKLQKADGSTKFSTKSSVSSSARSFAKRVGMELETETPPAKAAKKTTKSKSQKTKKQSSSCDGDSCSTSCN